MASTIAAITTGIGGVVTTADATGNLSLLSGTTTVVAVTSTGASITGTITGSSTVAGSTGILYPLTSGTAQATTSGTSIDFTSIPSWVKRITVMFNGISVTTGGVAGSSIIVQIGYSGGLLTTSTYLGATTTIAAAVVTTAYSNGFMIETAPVAARTYQGIMTLVNITGNGWCELHTLGLSDVARCVTGAGFATLSGVLTQIRITTQSGTDTFDAGTVNILYE